MLNGRSITLIQVWIRRTRQPWLDPAARCRRGAASWPRSWSRCEGQKRKERFWTYQMSSENFSYHVTALRPFTCAQPVIPGMTSCRRNCSGVYHEYEQEKGPSADQAHVAFEDIPQFRQLVEPCLKRPRPVSRSASGRSSPALSRPSVMVRNSSIVKRRPFKTARSWRKSAGDTDRQADRLPTQRHASTGARTTRPAAAATKSNERFTERGL